MKLVIVTGMSGAGKTQALKMLEDMGFYCVDNLPISLAEQFKQLLTGNSGNPDRVALGLDIRSKEELPLLEQLIRRWKADRFVFEILFLEAGNEVLVKRYKETRRAHPLAKDGRVETGVEAEREKLQFLKHSADYIIDTSRLLNRELRRELEKIFVEEQGYNNLFITVLSFGFKYGIPTDSDLLFDVRFLPNPYYEDELKELTGETVLVQEFVKKDGSANAFLRKLNDLLEFLLPLYIAEGKNQLVISIGCTGGKHRSVTIAKALYEKLSAHQQYGVKLIHRDMENGALK